MSTFSEMEHTISMKGLCDTSGKPLLQSFQIRTHCIGKGNNDLVRFFPGDKVSKDSQAVYLTDITYASDPHLNDYNSNFVWVIPKAKKYSMPNKYALRFPRMMLSTEIAKFRVIWTISIVLSQNVGEYQKITNIMKSAVEGAVVIEQCIRAFQLRKRDGCIGILLAIFTFNHCVVNKGTSHCDEWLESAWQWFICKASLGRVYMLLDLFRDLLVTLRDSWPYGDNLRQLYSNEWTSYRFITRVLADFQQVIDMFCTNVVNMHGDQQNSLPYYRYEMDNLFKQLATHIAIAASQVQPPRVRRQKNQCWN